MKVLPRRWTPASKHIKCISMHKVCSMEAEDPPKTFICNVNKRKMWSIIMARQYSIVIATVSGSDEKDQGLIKAIRYAGPEKN